MATTSEASIVPLLLLLCVKLASASVVSVADPASKLKAAIIRCSTVTSTPVEEWKKCYCDGVNGGACATKHYLFGACVVAYAMIELDTQTVKQLSTGFKEGRPKNDEKLLQCPTTVSAFWSTAVATVTKASKTFYPTVSTKSSLQQTYDACLKDPFKASITKEGVASVTCRNEVKSSVKDEDWTRNKANAFFACIVGFLAIKKSDQSYEEMLDKKELDTFLDEKICGSVAQSIAAAEQRGAMLTRNDDSLVGIDTFDDDNILMQVQNIDHGVARFFAPDAAWQRSVAARLGLSYPITALAYPVEGKIAPGTKLEATQIHDVIGDGNCFFRSLSFLLSGDEELLHKQLRKLVRRELMQYYNDAYKHLCEVKAAVVNGVQKFATAPNAKDCLAASAGDSTSGLWVTDREQFATASLLNSNVYIYQSGLAQPYNIATYGWQIYNPLRRQLNSQGERVEIEGRSVYLNNQNGNHFQVVTKATK